MKLNTEKRSSTEFSKGNKTHFGCDLCDSWTWPFCYLFTENKRNALLLLHFTGNIGFVRSLWMWTSVCGMWNIVNLPLQSYIFLNRCQIRDRYLIRLKSTSSASRQSELIYIFDVMKYYEWICIQIWTTHLPTAPIPDTGKLIKVYISPWWKNLPIR